MAGLWVFQIGDNTNVFPAYKFGISRAMKANGCTGATDYDSAIASKQTQSFPIGSGNPDDTCLRLTNCPALYPLVVCPALGPSRNARDSIVNPAFSTFLKLFSTPPLRAP